MKSDVLIAGARIATPAMLALALYVLNGIRDDVDALAQLPVRMAVVESKQTAFDTELAKFSMELASERAASHARSRTVYR